MALALLLVCPAAAEFVDPTFGVVGPPVYCLSVAGDTMYVGGDQLWTGPNTGGFAALNATTGARLAHWPRVDGDVYAIAADGVGGWYIGGTFHLVAGVTRDNLAHVRADGTLDDWDPGANSTVGRIVVSGSTVYVCGSFTVVGGQTRVYVAALEAATGHATPWNPSPDGQVNDVAVGGSTVYVGGTFSHVGGQPRERIAALGASSGLATAWNPGANYDVQRIVVADSTVYVAGGFTRMGGQTRSGLAALDAATGAVTDWAASGGAWGVKDLVVAGSTVYVGGTFRWIGGADRRCIAALDATTGVAQSWNPDVDSLYGMYDPSWDFVGALAVDGSRVFVGGCFGNIGYRDRSNLAALEATTDVATDWAPGANLPVRTLAVSGDTVLVGGVFSSVGGRIAGPLVAVDLGTGAATEWTPGLLHANALSLATRSSTVYIGNGWWSEGDELSGPLGAFDVSTGLPAAWDPGGEGSVRALAVDDSLVYADGSYVGLDGVSRTRFAALDAVTGSMTSWSPMTDGAVRSLAWRGDTLLMGGLFTLVGGFGRGSLAALDVGAGAVTGWNPGADGEVDALFAAGPTTYVGGRFSIVGGQARTGIAALDASTGLATSWNPGTASTQLGVDAIVAIGATVYAGGSFSTMGGAPRSGLAALDAATGQATGWDPAADGSVRALAARGTSVYAGGYLRRLGGRVAGALARIRPSPAEPPEVTVLRPNGGETIAMDAVCQIEWSATAPGPGVESVDLYVSTTGVQGPWRLIAAGAPNSGAYDWRTSELPASGSCYLRADARDYAGNLRSDVSDAAFVIASGILAADPRAGIAALSLGGVRPNPVRGAGRFEYVVPWAGAVRLTLVDVTGREVRVLADRDCGAGRHSGQVDAGGLRAGLYFLRLRSAGVERARRIVVVR